MGIKNESMRFVGFMLSLVIIFIVLFLSGLLLPSKVTISKSVLINATSTEVKREVLEFDHWKNWYPAFKNENVSIKDNPASVKVIHSVSLKDNKGKELRLDLIKSKADTIEIHLESASSTKVNYQFIITHHGDGQTQLTWNVNTFMPWYPWEKIKGIFLDKVSGPQYEEALIKLKKSVENKSE